MDKLKAIAYYSGIPANNNNPEKPLILDNFLQGVKNSGDIAIAQKDFNIVDADVALIQGFVHEHGKSAPHLKLRKNVLDYQKSRGKKSLVVDSNLFLYADKGNSKRYLRYSFDGVFPTTGYYFDKRIDPDRWNKISSNLDINLKPWRTSGDNVLICLQRNGGWSMRGLEVQEWLDKVIVEIRKHSRKRHIVVRLHPGDKKMPRMIRINHKNVSLSSRQNILEDLQNAWATVVYNSSPAVASAIEGVPVFITDPLPQHSQAADVANFDLGKLEDPVMPNREQWVSRLAMCHWNFAELKSGEAWSFFRENL